MDITQQFGRILHGGDYNPEQWPEDVWADDMRLMREAHWNVATLPVFGWVHLQPSEDTFRFEWLDRILDKLHENGIRACLATATASVPAWLDQHYPDVLRVNQQGQRLKHGNRHSFCPNSSNFRRLSTTLVQHIAERYRDHPALELWHVGNEYGGVCYCDQCAAAFRVWLHDRYGSLDEVNRRWYTAFWGHTFTEWSQIDTPTTNGERSIQALLIDYDRFQSESLLNCFRAEAAILREITPRVPIMTNLMGWFKPLDYHRWAQEMDIVSWDCYPRKDAPPAEIAFGHSLMRGLREGQPWLLMEQTPSQQNWQAHNALKRPGIMRLWSYQALAHGADSVMYFQWRRGRGAQEKFHGAVVEHVGTSEPRVFTEVAALGRELQQLGTQTLGNRVAAHVALLFDWDNWWAIEYSSGPSVDLRYVPQVQNFYNALHALNIPTDVISPAADLSRYDLVIAPVLYMVKPGIAEKLESFTNRGGTFVTTFFSGIVDENDLVYLGGYPGPFRSLLGIWAEEIDALTPEQQNSVVFAEPWGGLHDSYPCGLLCDRIHAETAQVLATYGDDFYTGEAAVTVNQYGAGKAYYLATALDQTFLQPFLEQLCSDQGITAPLAGVPASVEIMPRIASDGTTQLYVLNHNTTPVVVPLPMPHDDLLTNNTYNDQLTLPTYGVAILVQRST